MSKQSCPNTYTAHLEQCFSEKLAEHPVYQNNTFAIRCNALHNHFPLLKASLGDTVFSALAQVYAKLYLSNCWDINLYGNEFPSFIHAQEKSGRCHNYDWPALAWLANIEYRLLCLYYDDSVDEVCSLAIPLSETVSAAYMIDQLEKLPQYHPWIEVDIKSIQHLTKHGENALLAKRYLNHQGFCILIKAFPDTHMETD